MDETLRADIADCRAAHRRLRARVADVGDDTLREASRLSGWTVGHVLAHLARNADSVVRRLHAARSGQEVEQYPGGPAERAAQIEAGSRRPAADLVADLLRADDDVDRAFEEADDRLWAATVRLGGGARGPARDLVLRRWREVEAHHVDLGLGYEWSEWPDRLVRRWLPSLLTELPDRAGGHALVAWTTGRGPAPELPPWG